MELKLKINNRQDVTMAVSEAAPAVHLAYMASYQPGDLIRLETDAPGTLCEIQLDEAMHPVVVYLAGTSACFAVPFGERRSALSPKAFRGECHLLTARVLGPAERQQRRKLACNPYDGFAEPGLFPPMLAPMWKPETRRCSPPGTPLTASLPTPSTGVTPTAAGAPTGPAGGADAGFWPQGHGG